MNKRNVLLVAAGLMISFFSAHAEQDFLDKELPIEIIDQDIVMLEKRILFLSELHKKAQAENNENRIKNIENTLKELFKERARRVKNLEKKGYAPVINRSLLNTIEWRTR